MIKMLQHPLHTLSVFTANTLYKQEKNLKKEFLIQLG